MQLNLKQCFITIFQWGSLLLALSLGSGCSTFNITDTEREQSDKAESWRSDPFMHRATKVTPMISKTVILSDGKSEEEQEDKNNK